VEEEAIVEIEVQEIVVVEMEEDQEDRFCKLL
jgi:hypothetical protein